MTEHNTMRARALAVGLLLAAFLLLWFGAVTPYREALSRSQQELEEIAAQIQNYRRVAGADVTEDGAGEEVTALLLPGKTPAAAAAYMQQNISGLISSSNASLLSFELISAETPEAAPLEPLTGRIRVTANTQALRAMLHALEAQRPLLVLDNLFVRARSNLDAVPGGNLDIQLDVSGYREAAP